MQWECNNCATVHDANPTTCENCSYAVLTQYRPPKSPTDDREIKYSSSDAEPASWWPLITAFVVFLLVLLGIGYGVFLGLVELGLI